MLATLLSPIKHLYTLSPGRIFSSPVKAFTFSPPPAASAPSSQDNASHSSTHPRRRTSRLLRKESSLTLHTKRADARRAYVKHQHQQKRKTTKKEGSTLPLPGAWPGTFYQPAPLSSDSTPGPIDPAASSTTRPHAAPSNLNHTKSTPTNIPSLLNDAQTAFSSEPGLFTSDAILLDQLEILGRKTVWKKELENARELADRGVESARNEKKMWEDVERSGKAKKWDGRLMGWEERKRRCEARKAMAKEKEKLQDGYAYWRVRYGVGNGDPGAKNLNLEPDGTGRKETGVNSNAGGKVGKTTYRGRHEPYIPRPLHPRPQFRPQRPPPQSQPSPPRPPQVHPGQAPAQTTAQFTEALRKMVEEATRARERQTAEEMTKRKQQEDIEAERLYKEWRETKDRQAREAKEKAERGVRQAREWAEKTQRFRAAERERQQKEVEEKRRKEEQGQREQRHQQRAQPTHSTTTSTTSSGLLQVFEAYEAKWTVLRSTPPPPSDVACPLDQQVAFQDLPWPLLFSPSSLLDFNTSNIGAFIFHPQRPGINGKNKKDIVRAEIKRWHPDKFESSVGRRVIVPANTEEGSEIVKEVSKAITGALNDLLCKVA